MKLQKRTKLEKFLEGFQDILWAIECRFDWIEDDSGCNYFMDALNTGWWEMYYYEKKN